MLEVRLPIPRHYSPQVLSSEVSFYTLVEITQIFGSSILVLSKSQGDSKQICQGRRSFHQDVIQ
jgi:hypothetical protein